MTAVNSKQPYCCSCGLTSKKEGLADKRACIEEQICREGSLSRVAETASKSCYFIDQNVEQTLIGMNDFIDIFRWHSLCKCMCIHDWMTTTRAGFWLT